MTAGLIALIVLAVFVFIVAAAGRSHRPPGESRHRGAPRSLPAARSSRVRR